MQPSTSKADKATMVSSDLIYNSPEKCRLRRRIKQMKEEHVKKVKTLQQNLRRSSSKITNLKNILKTLHKKHLLNEEQVDLLHTLSGSNGKLFERLLQKKNAQPLPKQYEKELRSFALTLHYYSPRAYEYVRSQFDFCLPHVKTISRWYNSIDGNPGISSEALHSIKQRVNNTPYKLLGALVFDEMNIRQHVEYDGTKFSGYVDMGNNIASTDTTLATHALVFLLVCLNSAWKLPIAYYFINSVTGQEKCNLLNRCLSAVHETGLRIVSVTCDGASTNFVAFKQLGCNFDDIYSLQTSFPHPVTGEKVVAFPDPCHMLKLIRNTFGDLEHIIDDNNQQIRWSYINQLHNLQQNEGMHLGNKLRSAHINFKKQKMKVRLAAQVFSKSVSDSLTFCKNNLMLKEFELCEGTIKFLLVFNYLFDILNSKNMKQIELKQPMNQQNIELIINKLNEYKRYILTLKMSTGQLLINSRRKTGFVGFLICIESSLILYEELCKNNTLLKYLPFYKLSQDHLELLFGCIRQHGGGNNNPNVRQFKAAMKKILVHAEIRNIDSGNCIPLEEISILHVSSVRKIIPSEDVINSSARLARLHDDDVEDNYDELDNLTNFMNDHSYMLDVREISEFSTNVIQYIAGYVVIQLKKKLRCEDCINALILTSREEKNNLISVKSRGGLIQPSEDVIMICRKCEIEIRCIIHTNDRKSISHFNEHYISNKVLTRFINTKVFHNLSQHAYDQPPLENHVLHLTRAVIKKYVKIRLHYIALNTCDNSNSQRHFFNKLVLFKGQ